MIHFVIALDCEAKPLISHYRLGHQEAAFPMYRKEGVALVVSGIGKMAAAAATAYLYARSGEHNGAVWFNVGVAGHRHRPVGDAVLASEIGDRASRRFWQLHPIDTGLATATVLTVDEAEERFDTEHVYEMEAAGFCSTASRLTSPERVQCYKVISDNQSSATERITAKDVENLIRVRMHEIDSAVRKTVELADKP